LFLFYQVKSEGQAASFQFASPVTSEAASVRCLRHFPFCWHSLEGLGSRPPPPSECDQQGTLSERPQVYQTMLLRREGDGHDSRHRDTTATSCLRKTAMMDCVIRYRLS